MDQREMVEGEREGEQEGEREGEQEGEQKGSSVGSSEGGRGVTRSNRWWWVGLAGGLVDLGLVGWAFGGMRTRRTRRRSRGLPLAMGAVAGLTIVDVVMAMRAGKGQRRDGSRAPREEPSLAITVDRPATEVYAFLRNPENLSRFLSSVESVRLQSDDRIEVRVKSLAGKQISCLATVMDERPGESLTWIASAGEGEPFCGGTVQLTKAPGERGTEVRLALDGLMGAAGGSAGKSILRLWTREKLRNDLRRMKQILELGQPTRSDASVHSGMHAARPSQSNTNLRVGAPT